MEKRRFLHLQGSSVIEAVTASVLFLVIFALALQAVVGMSIKEVRPHKFMEAEKEYRLVLSESINGVYSIGVHRADFDWGNMEIRLERYEKTADLIKVSITIYKKNNREKMMHRHIIKPVKITET